MAKCVAKYKIRTWTTADFFFQNLLKVVDEYYK